MPQQINLSRTDRPFILLPLRKIHIYTQFGNGRNAGYGLNAYERCYPLFTKMQEEKNVVYTGFAYAFSEIRNIPLVKFWRFSNWMI